MNDSPIQEIDRGSDTDANAKADSNATNGVGVVRDSTVRGRAGRTPCGNTGTTDASVTDANAPEANASNANASEINAPNAIAGERDVQTAGDQTPGAQTAGAQTTNAEAYRQLQSQFLATISHELRTPLTALAGYGELLADGILGTLSPSQHDTIERMRAVTNQLTVMIDSILTFTSLQAEAEKPVLSLFDPMTVLGEAAGLVEPIARKKGITLEVTTATPPVAPLCSDREKIRQILMHLADNAIKFIVTPSGGRVDLSVTDGEGGVTFSVRDTGIGIAADDIPRLFLPFVQADTGLTRSHGGMGLGLYIAQNLAMILCGEITVESVLGAGSTFSLRIPRS